MPFGYGVPPNQPQADNTAKFGKDLIADVIPYIDSTYRTLANRSNRAIVGLSMGGGQALNIGLNNIDVFSHVGGFSAAIGNAANFPKTYSSLIGNAGDVNGKLKLLWIGCGTEDSLFGASKSFSEWLAANKITHTVPRNRWRPHVDGLAPISAGDLTASVQVTKTRAEHPPCFTAQTPRRRETMDCEYLKRCVVASLR